MNTVISNNVIRRARQAAIQYRGGNNDGISTIQGNQITHTGYPYETPPGALTALHVTPPLLRGTTGMTVVQPINVPPEREVESVHAGTYWYIRYAPTRAQ